MRIKLTVEESNLLDKLTARCKMNVAVSKDGDYAIDFDERAKVSIKTLLDYVESNIAATEAMFSKEDVASFYKMYDKYILRR